ncbi:MAG: hypothetical protein V9G04_04235 [Nocardioides sp.]|jgi:hypothetical protein
MDQPREESTARAMGRAVQGVLLERVMVGVALMALVVVAAGFLEATGGVRLAVVGVGAVSLLGWLIWLRSRWSDPISWAFGLSALVAQMAAFFLAVTS